MKKHLLIAIALIFSIPAFSQEPGAYNIIIDTDNEEHANYESFVKKMVSYGYKIDEKDDLFHTVTFDPVKYKFETKNGHRWNYIIVSASFVNKSFAISGQNKKKGQRKRKTIYDPNSPESVGAFKVMLDMAIKMEGKISYSVIPNFGQKKEETLGDMSHYYLYKRKRPNSIQ